jgi:hypothetical protein
MNFIVVPALNAPPLTELPLAAPMQHVRLPFWSVVAVPVTPSTLVSLPHVARGATVLSRLDPAARPSGL